MSHTDRRFRLRRPHWRRTIRFRLVAGQLALTALACLALASATTLTLRAFLFHQLDQRLLGAQTRYQGTDHDHDDDDGTRPAINAGSGFGDDRGQEVGTLGAHLKNGKLTSFGIVGRPHPPALTSSDERRLAALPIGQPVSRDLDPLGDYRLIAASEDGVLTITGLPQRPVSDAMAELLLVELIAFGVLLAATAAGSVVLVSFSLRPLENITKTAVRVLTAPLTGDDPLPQRAEIADPASEVGQLGTAFNRMLDHVEAGFADRAASEARLRHFIADASHELRTPVASVRSHAESVLRHAQPLPEAVTTALGRIEAEAIRLGVLVDELLLLARLDAGRNLASDEVDLSRLIIDATSDAQATSSDKNWRLSLPEQPITIRGDEVRLHQVLANLLENAARYTPAGTTVTTLLRRTGNSVELDVQDNGPGISATHLPRLFERFYRANAAAGTGSGLGLAIASAVVQAHKGTISVASSPGKTQFRVTLPAQEQPAEAHGAGADSQS